MIRPYWLNHNSSKWGPSSAGLQQSRWWQGNRKTHPALSLLLLGWLWGFTCSVPTPQPRKVPYRGSSCWGSDWQRLSLERPSVCMLFPPRGILLSLADAAGKCSLKDLHTLSQMQNDSASSVLYSLTAQLYQHLMSSSRTIQRIVCGHQKGQIGLYRTCKNIQLFFYWWLNSCENYFRPYLPNNT